MFCDTNLVYDNVNDKIETYPIFISLRKCILNIKNGSNDDDYNDSNDEIISILTFELNITLSEHINSVYLVSKHNI